MGQVDTDIRQALKIEMAGTVTSFRYPLFTQGMQPTFEMPPPSTIHGHVCSAVGDWVDPRGLEFGYYFTHAGKFTDFREHLHFEDPIQPFPFNRQLLFQPRLTLYLNDLALLAAFQNPHYPVVLGRSQDLMTYLEVKPILLHRVKRAYFERTLLPPGIAPLFQHGTISVTMARYIDPRRRVNWNNYAILFDPAIYPPFPRQLTEYEEEGGLVFEGYDLDLWIDPDSPPHKKFRELKRAVYFHKFVED